MQQLLVFKEQARDYLQPPNFLAKTYRQIEFNEHELWACFKNGITPRQIFPIGTLNRMTWGNTIFQNHMNHWITQSIMGLFQNWLSQAAKLKFPFIWHPPGFFQQWPILAPFLGRRTLCLGIGAEPISSWPHGRVQLLLEYPPTRLVFSTRGS